MAGSGGTSVAPSSAAAAGAGGDGGGGGKQPPKRPAAARSTARTAPRKKRKVTKSARGAVRATSAWCRACIGRLSNDLNHRCSQQAGKYYHPHPSSVYASYTKIVQASVIDVSIAVMSVTIARL